MLCSWEDLKESSGFRSQLLISLTTEELPLNGKSVSSTGHTVGSGRSVLRPNRSAASTLAEER